MCSRDSLSLDVTHVLKASGNALLMRANVVLLEEPVAPQQDVVTRDTSATVADVVPSPTLVVTITLVVQ